LSKPKM